MTLAVVLKVGDGLVLGADSAASLTDEAGDVANVYNSAEKIVNLVKGEPIGLVLYGLGGLAGRSLTSLMRDLRLELASPDAAKKLPPGYTMEYVAKRVYEFLYVDLYQKEYPKKGKDKDGKPVDVYASLGCIVTGYSSGVRRSQSWLIEVDSKGQCPGPELHFDLHHSGMLDARGMPEAVYRLMMGWSPMVLEGMVRAGVPEGEARKFLHALPMTHLAHPAMPIQDAIELVDFLIRTTCDFVRFDSGPPTVAPPIDLAAITPHEGFRWVRRKHYYSVELNP